MARIPTKLGALIKKYGPFKGSGEFAGKQVGGPAGKALKSIVPLYLMLATVALASPQTAGAITSPLSKVPVASQLAGSAVTTGLAIRQRLGMNGMA